MTRLYDRDFFGWTLEQADALKRRSPNELDWDHLLEEIESLGRSQRSELRSRMRVLIAHLLKWTHQVSFRSASWEATIREQRRQVAQLMEENPSLKTVLTEVYDDAYKAAVVEAVAETGLAARVFTDARPIAYETAMSGPLDPREG